MNLLTLLKFTIFPAVVISFGLGYSLAKLVDEGLFSSGDDVAVSADHKMSAVHKEVLDEFVRISKKPIKKMVLDDRQFFKTAVDEYQVECLFSVVDENRKFCTGFAAALAAHNELNQEKDYSSVLQKVRN